MSHNVRSHTRITSTYGVIKDVCLSQLVASMGPPRPDRVFTTYWLREPIDISIDYRKLCQTRLLYLSQSTSVRADIAATSSLQNSPQKHSLMSFKLFGSLPFSPHTKAQSEDAD
eukprot:5724617-Pyramimonas_sp.AAC.1